MRLGVAAAVVGGSLVPGDVAIDDGVFSGVGLSPAGRGLAAPGFVDLQVNGFAGVDLLVADAAGYAQAGDAIARTGVTAYQPTFISSPLDTCQEALSTLASLDGTYRGPRILPAHLEGPFLSPRRHGAHDPANLRPVDLAVADALCDAGPVGFMTIAPELDGGLELIAHLAQRRIVVSLGHSDASTDVAAAAFDAGAEAVTHIFNAMRPWQPRDPGLSGLAMTRPDVFVMAIVDNVHLAPETAELLVAVATGRLVLVTDAIEAAGLGDGTYRLGDRTVHVSGPVARLADGTLAGSVLAMDKAVRNLVEHGASVEVAVDAATRVPARLVRRDDVGSIRIGAAADVVVLDDALEVSRTLVGGRELHAAA
jgi:N-acetylglucosamine-6-phosphate deacetylase